MMHFRTIRTSVALGTFAALAGVAVAQSPSPGPSPAPGAATSAKTPAAPNPSAAPVAPTPPPAAPKPAAELAQLKVLEGSWHCDGKQPAGPFGPEQSYKSTLKAKKDVDNFWIAIEYDQKKSKTHPMAGKARGFLGYDQAAKRYISVAADNTGGWTSESSPGWEGDKLVFSGDGSLGGQKVSLRETYTKKTDKELTWTCEMKMGKDWISVANDSCKK